MPILLKPPFKQDIMTVEDKSVERWSMMNLKMWIPIVAIVSVAVMVIWGFVANSWQYCWLSVFVGGIIMAILSIVNANMKKK